MAEHGCEAARSTSRIGIAGLVLLLVVPGGCGFHLRSWDVGSSVETVHVAANARNPMQAPLEQALRQAGVDLVERDADPTLVVELLDARQERRNISVSGRARAAEYEAVLSVRYRIMDASGAELIPAQWLARERVFRVDRDNLVGSSEEQALLEREMRSDLVQQILRAVNAVAPRPAAPVQAAPVQAPGTSASGAPEPKGAG